MQEPIDFSCYERNKLDIDRFHGCISAWFDYCFILSPPNF